MKTILSVVFTIIIILVALAVVGVVLRLIVGLIFIIGNFVQRIRGKQED